MSKTILIVDDDADFNTLLTDVFSQADFEVTPTQKPEDALEKFKDKPFDLVVTDYKMPSMSGTDFLREVREVKAEVPVVVVSGFLDNDAIRELIKFGVGGIFLKPLNIFSLLKRTQELVKDGSEVAAGGAAGGAAPGAEEGENAGDAPAAGAGGAAGGSLPFPFKSMPCRSPTSLAFAKNLYAMREFKGNLLVIGEKGSNFEGICEDIVGFSAAGGTEDRLVVLNQTDYTEAGLLLALQDAVKAGAKRITVGILATETLTENAKAGVFCLAKSEPPFAGLGATVRFVFCLREDLDSLYDKGELDENLYIFLGTTEITVPALADCVEDIIPVAEQALADEQARSGKKGTVTIEPDGKRFLRELQGPRTYQDIVTVVVSAHKMGDDPNVITEENLRYAHEFKGRRAKTKFPPLSEHLRQARNEYAKAWLLLTGDAGRAAAYLGIDAALVEAAAAGTEPVRGEVPQEAGAAAN